MSRSLKSAVAWGPHVWTSQVKDKYKLKREDSWRIAGWAIKDALKIVYEHQHVY